MDLEAYTSFSKARALDDHKRFLNAVASKKTEHAAKIIRLGLQQGRGIRTLLERVLKAAKGLYKPKDYQEEDYMRGLVLWKLQSPRFEIKSVFHPFLSLHASLSLMKLR